MATGLTPDRFKTFLLTRSEPVKRDIKAELVKQARRLASAQKATVHSRSGKTAESIRVIEGRSVTAGGSRNRSGGLENDLVVQVRAGGPLTTSRTAAGEYDHANAEEWGTQKMPAQPFFFNTYRAMKASIEGEIGAAIHRSVDFNMRRLF